MKEIIWKKTENINKNRKEFLVFKETLSNLLILQIKLLIWDVQTVSRKLLIIDLQDFIAIVVVK